MTMAHPATNTAHLQAVRNARRAIIRSNFAVAATSSDAAMARVHENVAETLRALDTEVLGIPLTSAQQLADSYCAAIYLRQRIGGQQCPQWHALMSAARLRLAEFGTDTWRRQ